MCGITGWINLKNDISGEKNLVEKMSQTLARRRWHLGFTGCRSGPPPSHRSRPHRRVPTHDPQTRKPNLYLVV